MMKTIIRKLPGIRLLSTLIIILFSVNYAYAQNSSGVLVATVDSLVSKGEILDIRRVYLGLPSSSDSLINKPVLNLTDPSSYKRFLKNVLHMTENGYQRRIIKRVFRQGGRKITEVRNTIELVNYLAQHPNDVSFMEKELAENTKGIKIVQILW